MSVPGGDLHAKALELSKEISEEEKEMGLEILSDCPGYSRPVGFIGLKIAPGAALITRSTLGLAVLIALEADGLATLEVDEKRRIYRACV